MQTASSISPCSCPSVFIIFLLILGCGHSFLDPENKNKSGNCQSALFKKISGSVGTYHQALLPPMQISDDFFF
jgi:hypothetical protein